MAKISLRMIVFGIVLAFSTVPDLLAEKDSAGKHVEAVLVELKESQDETSGKEDNLINETKLETAKDSGTHEQNNVEDEASSQASGSDLPEEG